MQQMSETMNTKLPTINVNSLAERVEQVESGLRPILPTPASHTSPGSASQPNTSAASEGPVLCTDRDPEEALRADPGEVLVWPEDDPELNGDDQGCQLHRVSTAMESLHLNNKILRTSAASEGPVLCTDRDPVEAFRADPGEVLVWPEDDPELNGDDQGCQLHRGSTAMESLHLNNKI